MADEKHLEIELTITPPGDRMPMEQIYADRELQRLEAEHQRVLNINTSEESLAKSAEGGKAMEKSQQVLAPTREQIVQTMQALKEPAWREALSKVMETVTGLSLEKMQQSIEEGTLSEQAGLKLLDPAGSIVEETAKRTATESGLPEEAAQTIGGAAGLLAGILFPGTIKRGKKVAEQAGKLRKLSAEQRDLMRKFLAGEIPEAELRVNLERIGGGERIKETARKLNLLHAGRMKESREVVTHGETIAASRGALSLEQALKLSDDDLILNKDAGLALRDLYNTTASRLDDLTKRVLGGERGLDDELYETFLIASELAVKDEMVGRNVARALEARKILSEAGRAPVTLDDMIRLRERFLGADLPDGATLAQMLEGFTAAQRRSWLARVGSGLRAGQNAIYELWINALLTGPQSHAANVLSNTTVAAWAPAERFLAATYNALEAGVRGKPREVFFGESSAMLYAFSNASADAIRMAGRALRRGTSEIGQEKVERIGSISAEAFGRDPNTVIGAGLDYLGAVVRVPGRALIAEDAFFKGFNYRIELHALAYRTAAGEGLSGADMAARMRQLIANPPSAVKAQAETFALVQTFTQELSELGTLGRVSAGLMAAADAAPMGRVVVPFIRTPTNILHYAMERTPVLNAVSDTLLRDIAAGGERRALAMGKVGTGMFIGAALTSLAAGGMISGGGPREKASRDLVRATGWQPYAIRVGDQWYAYSRLDPVGMTLGILADYAEIAGEIPAGRRAEFAAAFALAVSRHLLHKTYMTGIADVLEAMQAPENRLADYLRRLSRTLVPTGVRQFTRTQDPTLRETRDLTEVQELLNEIRAGIPGYSADLPPRRNLWGDPIVLTGGWGPDLISPIYASTQERDPVTEEIIRQKVALTMPRPLVFGSRGPSTLQFDEPRPAIEAVPLTPGEYDRLLVLTGKGVPGQPPLKDALATMMRTTEYQQQTDGPDGGKALLIRKVVDAYKRAAMAQLLTESLGLQDLLRQKAEDKARALTPAPVVPPPAGRLTIPGIIESLGR